MPVPFLNIGKQILLFDRYFSPEEIVNLIDSVKADNVKEALYDRLFDQCPAVAGLGAIEGLPEYSRIRGWSYWNRI